MIVVDFPFLILNNLQQLLIICFFRNKEQRFEDRRYRLELPVSGLIDIKKL